MTVRTTRVVTVVALVLAVVASLGLTAGAAAKKKKALRPPTCQQTIAAIQGNAYIIAADLATQGYTPDEVRGPDPGYRETCRLIPPNKRRGSGTITDYLPYNSDPNYEGQPFYTFTWYQVVTRTRKGKLTSTIEDFSCRYAVQTGTALAGGRPC
jgi:hypothetical protein